MSKDVAGNKRYVIHLQYTGTYPYKSEPITGDFTGGIGRIQDIKEGIRVIVSLDVNARLGADRVARLEDNYDTIYDDTHVKLKYTQVNDTSRTYKYIVSVPLYNVEYRGTAKLYLNPDYLPPAKQRELEKQKEIKRVVEDIKIEQILEVLSPDTQILVCSYNKKRELYKGQAQNFLARHSDLRYSRIHKARIQNNILQIYIYTW